MVRGRLFAAVVAAVFSVGAGHAAAAVITVNTTSDDTNNGDGLCSLRKAIADVDAPGSNNGDCAPAAFGANTIKLGPRRYVLSARPLDASSSLRIPSTVTDLAIVGSGEAATTIDAQSANARALEIAAGANVKLTDLTLTGGHAPDGAIGTASLNASPGGEGGTGANGGAVLNAGTLTLSDVAITGSAAGDGGAGGNGSSSTSSSGTAGGPGGAGGEGGAIYNTG
jgi:CSLREA domain-containing protein